MSFNEFISSYLKFVDYESKQDIQFKDYVPIHREGRDDVRLGTAKIRNKDIVVKSWKSTAAQREDSDAGKTNPSMNSCLFSERNVYVYITTFLVEKRFSPNIQYTVGHGLNQNTDWFYTPKWSMSLADASTNPDYDFQKIFFQVVYSIATMASVGLRHNDLHANNILVEKFSDSSRNAYKTFEKTYVVEGFDWCVLFDFDRSGIDNPIVSAMRNGLIPFNKTCVTAYQEWCRLYNQCSPALEGRRDFVNFCVSFLALSPGNPSVLVVKKWILGLFDSIPVYKQFLKYIRVIDNNRMIIDIGNVHKWLYTDIPDKDVLEWPIITDFIEGAADMAELETGVLETDTVYNGFQDVYESYRDWVLERYPSTELMDQIYVSDNNDLDCMAPSI